MASSTFYAQQAANRRRSLLLMFVVVLLLAVLGFAIGFGFSGDPAVAVAITAGAAAFALTLSLGSYFGGDKIVLAASSARRVEEGERPPLMNVVRELSIAAGVPMPAVYTIDDSAPNAFATGRNPEHASIAITTGLLEQLDREELQGVIGHELSHVRNLDIRFALLMGVLVGTIVLLADWALRYAFYFGGGRSRRGKGNGLQAILLVVGIVLAILGPIGARLVQLAVSRQREYLADASSVELTRNPAGLERALAKIAGDPPLHEFPTLVARAERFRERLLSAHGLPLKVVARLRLLKPTYLYITNLDLAAAFTLSRGLEPTVKAREDCDIALSSDALSYLLEHLWGGETLKINGRFEVPPHGQFHAFDRYVTLGELANHGDSYLRHRVRRSLLAVTKRLPDRLFPRATTRA